MNIEISKEDAATVLKILESAVDERDGDLGMLFLKRMQRAFML